MKNSQGIVNKKKEEGRGKLLAAFSEDNTKEKHRWSTFVYKADGQTVYIRLKIWCLARGRKYQNSL